MHFLAQVQMSKPNRSGGRDRNDRGRERGDRDRDDRDRDDRGRQRDRSRSR